MQLWIPSEEERDAALNRARACVNCPAVIPWRGNGRGAAQERTRFIRRAYRIAPARVHEAGVMRSKRTRSR